MDVVRLPEWLEGGHHAQQSERIELTIGSLALGDDPIEVFKPDQPRYLSGLSVEP
jgi:hypothetical protein